MLRVKIETRTRELRLMRSERRELEKLIGERIMDEDMIRGIEKYIEENVEGESLKKILGSLDEEWLVIG